MIKTARRGLIPPFIVMDVMKAAQEKAVKGDNVVHMEVGQPALGAPEKVIKAAHRALDSHNIGYTEALGLPALRARIAQFYQEVHQTTIDPARIAITTGSSGAFLLAFLAAFDVGDKVVMAAPGYPAYRNILQALGIEPVLLPTLAEDKYQPSIKLLEALEETPAGLIVASPSNPTGTVLSQPELLSLAEYCRIKGIRLVVDEIYHGIMFGEKASTAAGLGEEIIIINSFSKYFRLTGWRLGFMITPPDLLRPIECLAQNLFISPPTLSQLAAIEAFNCEEELNQCVARYHKNRDILLEELPQAGFDKLTQPTGAFYLYADIANLSNDSQEFCRKMLKETGIAATPGLDFDPLRGNHFMRFCFSGSTEDVLTAARLLKDWRK